MKKRLYALFVAVGFLIAGPAYGEAGSTGLVSYWDLNDTAGNIATDSAGPNNGTIYGATAGTGIAGNGLYFDGSYDYIYIEDDASLHTTTMSFSLWLRPDTDPTSAFPHLMEKYSLSTGFFVQVINNKWFFHLNGLGIYATSEVKAGEWTHLVGTYDGSDLRIFVNGVNEATLHPHRDLINDNSQPLRIGGNGLADFKGTLDEIAIYNRALPLDEVQAIYDNGLQGLGIGLAPVEEPAPPVEEPAPPVEEPAPPVDETPEPPLVTRFIEIDILPGNAYNAFNLKSGKAVPVAVLTTADFNAATLDPSSVTFGPAGLSPARGEVTLQDIDNDGDLDALFSFKGRLTGLTCDHTEATLTAETIDRQPVTGVDYIGSSRWCK